MRHGKWYVLAILAFVAVFATFVPAEAQGGPNTDRANPGFCAGQREFVFDGQQLDQNSAPCGATPDTLMVQLTAPWSPGNFNPGYRVIMTWRQAIQTIHAHGWINGSLWIVKPQSATVVINQPVTSGAAPIGFCEDKTGMPFGSGNPLPSSAPCSGTGLFVLVDPFSDVVAKGPTNKFPDWTSLLNEAAKWKGGSVWFEPSTSGATPAAQPTTSMFVQDPNAAVDWNTWCAGDQPFLFSDAHGVINVGNMTALKPPCNVTQVAVLEPWRLGCDSSVRQDQNPNCRPGHGYLFSSITEAAQWLSTNRWTEGSVWNRVGQSGGGGRDVCVNDLIKSGQARSFIPGSSDPCLDPSAAATATAKANPATATVQPSYTPQPTNTPIASNTPQPTQTAMPSVATETPVAGGPMSPPTGGFNLGAWLGANWLWLLLVILIVAAIIWLVRDRSAHGGQWAWQHGAASLPRLTNANPISAVHGVASVVNLTAVGGIAPYRNFRVVGGALPAGVVLDAVTGALNFGVGTVVGDSLVSLQVDDSSVPPRNSAPQLFTLHIA